MPDLLSQSMQKKLDYQLKWILSNSDEYNENYVRAASNELSKRKSSINRLSIKYLLNKFFYFGNK